jgi:phosphotransferase system enzyme I (PtsI)
MDLGADKNPKWSIHGTGDNPALGLCGIRLCLAEPQLFRTQLRAILRASAHGQVRILFPMINGITDLKQALAQLDAAKQELREEEVSFDEKIAVGAMIEVPSAALTVNMLAKHVNFLSIGTNDLIQYTLAIDRNDDAVSHLYDPTHPAVLYLLTHTLKTAAKFGLPVSVCGEMAGDSKMTRLLLGMGLRRFSMHPANLLSVKQIVLDTHLDPTVAQTAKILRASDPEKIADLLTQLNTPRAA